MSTLVWLPLLVGYSRGSYTVSFNAQAELCKMNEDEVRGVRDLATKTIFFYQLRALFLKNITLHRRNVATLLCQVIAPVVIISLAGFLQMLFDVIVDNYDNIIPGSGQVSFYSDSSWMVSCTPRTRDPPCASCPDKCYLDAFNIAFVNSDSNATAVHMPWVDHNLIPALNHFYYPPQRVLFDLPFIYYINDAGMDLGCLAPNGSRVGFLGNSLPPPHHYNFTLDFTINPQFNNRKFPSDPKYNGNTVHVPFFMELSNINELVNRLILVSREYSRLANITKVTDDQFKRNYLVQPISQLQYETVIKYIQARNFSLVRPHAGVAFRHIEDDVFSYILVAPLLLVYDNIPGVISTVDTCRRVMVSNLLHNAYFKHLTGNDKAGDPMIETLVMSLPSDVTKAIIDIAVVLGGLLYPFAFSLTIPVFVTSLVKDKHERHVIMMEQCGLSQPAYVIVTYVFNYCLYLFIAMVISVMSLAFRIRLYTQTSSLVLLVVMFIWGHAAVVMGFFFSNFFMRPRTAVVITYFLVIAGVVVSLMVNLFEVLSENKTPPFIYMMYPPFSFYRILFYLNRACTRYHCYSAHMLTPHGSNLFPSALLYLALSSVVTMVLSVYLSYVMPREYGVPKSPFFPIIALYRLLSDHNSVCAQRQLTNNSINRDEEDEETTILTEHSDRSCDEDVIIEEEYVSNNYDVIDAPLVLNKLRKEYYRADGPSYVAVYGFSVVVKRNECFGLLGPNGAGKTTLISLLTGLYEPTNGTARISGYDLATESHMISTHLGVCPQHDIQYDELTTMEHLLLYARLRGVYRRYEKSVVTAAMKQVNLLDAANKKSKQLSGGMRRRLSVAIACLADPDIIILDEPTTGLDPASRRQVWDVINNVKQNKSVILTTHAMEEADQLCTRIGIMNYGKLRCLGSPNKLKHRYGLGYQLHINLYPGRLYDVQQFISTHLPSATLVEYYACKISYKIDKEQLVVSELFSLLDSVKMQLGISDWGIKRTTLEDVFLTIVAKHHDDRMVTMENRTYWPMPCQYCVDKISHFKN